MWAYMVLATSSCKSGVATPYSHVDTPYYKVIVRAEHLDLGNLRPRATTAPAKRIMTSEEKPERRPGLLRSSVANIVAVLVASVVTNYCSIFMNDSFSC